MKIVDNIRNTLVIIEETTKRGKPWWMLSSSRKFTFSSTWESIRISKNNQDHFVNI